MSYINLYLDETGQFQAYAFPGGYPIYYVTADGGILCPKCCDDNRFEIEEAVAGDDNQWLIVGNDINYEDDNLYCDHCNKQIEPAYGN